MNGLVFPSEIHTAVRTCHPAETRMRYAGKCTGIHHNRRLGWADFREGVNVFRAPRRADH